MFMSHIWVHSGLYAILVQMSSMQPVFVTYDEKEREAYLSQLGNFSPAERSLFHTLCRIWEPNIPYSRFISMVNRDSANAPAELKRLMAKLRKARMGIIVTNLREGERNSAGIVICEPGQSPYFAYLLEEKLLDVQEELRNPLPTQRAMQEDNDPVPDTFINALSYKQAAELVMDKQPRDLEIIALSAGEDETFLVTTNSLPRFIALAQGKFRFYFQNNNFLALGASVMGMSLAELRKALGQRAPNFWTSLSSSFLSQREALLAQRKVLLPEDLFSISRVLSGFFSAQMEVARERKEQEQERAADMVALTEIIQKSESLLVPRDLFERHLESFREKYGKNFTQFQNAFHETYMVPQDNRNLSVILELDGSLIHEDNVRSLFIQRVDKISKELYRYYLPRMSRYVRNKQSELGDIFHSNATFEADIEDRVKEIDDLLANLLEKPATVAEAFIQAGRRTKAINTVDEMKAAIVSFFYPDQLKFKELQVIFNLSAKSLYEHAFLNFGIFRQLILRITGRHESFLQKFSAQSQSIFRKMESNSALPSDYSGLWGTDGNPARLSRPKKRSSAGNSSRMGDPGGMEYRRRKQATGSKGTQQSNNTQKPVRKYNEHEQNEAWNEFSKSLRK